MKPSRILTHLRLATGAVALLAGLAAHAADNGDVIKFSDPAKPGTIRIFTMRGDIRVRGADTSEVTVKTDTPPEEQHRNGMRVLSATSTYSLTEKENIVTLDASSDGWHGSASDFELIVPRSTTIVIRGNHAGGDIRCTDIDGDIQINCLNSEVDLRNVGGGVVVETQNGEISARIRQLREGKTLAFASVNGEIDVRVPNDAKANVRLRTQNGVVLTDFPASVMITKTEKSSGGGGSRAYRGLPPEAAEAIKESARMAANIGREVAESIREGFEGSRVELERAGDGRKVVRLGTPDVPPAPPVPKLPAIPPMPTFSGGSLVTGTLNGGGPEISIQTMNGDVTLGRLTSE